MLVCDQVDVLLLLLSSLLYNSCKRCLLILLSTVYCCCSWFSTVHDFCCQLFLLSTVYNCCCQLFCCQMFMFFVVNCFVVNCLWFLLSTVSCRLECWLAFVLCWLLYVVLINLLMFWVRYRFHFVLGLKMDPAWWLSFESRIKLGRRRLLGAFRSTVAWHVMFWRSLSPRIFPMWLGMSPKLPRMSNRMRITILRLWPCWLLNSLSRWWLELLLRPRNTVACVTLLVVLILKDFMRFFAGNFCPLLVDFTDRFIHDLDGKFILVDFWQFMNQFVFSYRVDLIFSFSEGTAMEVQRLEMSRPAWRMMRSSLETVLILILFKPL